MRKLIARTMLCACSIALLNSVQTVQAQWGSLEGQILFTGEIPNLPPKVMKGDPNSKDPTVCAVETIPDYRLTVNPESKGVQDVFIYLRKAPAQVNPELAKVPSNDLIVDQKHCQFIPLSLVVRCKQQVIAQSDDPIPHNIHGYNVLNPGFNFTVAPNDRAGQKVPIDKANNRPEPLPISVKCDIHTHMESWWLVIDHPYGAVTDANGRFKIEGLPVGKHSFVIWHNTAGYLEKAFEVEVKAGTTTLPPIQVKALMSGSNFQKLAPAK